MVPTTIGIFSLYILNPLKPYSVVRKKKRISHWLAPIETSCDNF